MAFSLDGAGGTGVATRLAASVGASIPATSNADNVLIAFVQVNATGGDGTKTVSSVTSSPSLTWTRRAQVITVNNGSGGDGAHICLELWWAHELTPTIVGARGVTATFSGNADGASIHVFAVTGANDPSAPWDINGALPASSNNLTNIAGVVDIPSVATTAGGTFGMAFFGSSQAAVPNTNDTGVTTLLTTSNNNGPGTYWSYTKSEYIAYSTPKTSFTFHMLGNVTQWSAIFDALSGSRQAVLNVTLDDVTLAGTGSAPSATGALNVTLDDVTLVATGTVASSAADSGAVLLLGL